MNLGFIGFGEAAFNISAGLREEGFGGIVAFDALCDQEPMGEMIRRRAAEAGVELLPTAAQVAAQVDILILSVPSSLTLAACQSFLGALRKGQIYADVGASTPEVKKQEWALVQDAGVLFADSAMLGSLPLSRHQVPIVASGNGAAAFREAMTPFGMKIEVVGDKPGEASAIKLVRSIYMKGMAALLFEMLEAAAAHGVADQVVASVGASLDGIPFGNHVDRLVTGTAIHAHRRAAELDGSIQMLEEAGLCSVMTAASRQRHAMLEPFGFAERFVAKKPGGWKEILDILQATEHITN